MSAREDVDRGVAARCDRVVDPDLRIRVRRDRGSITILAAVIAALVVAASATAVVVVAAVATSHAARNAADLAALAVASEASTAGSGAACTQGAAIAAANGGVMTGCSMLPSGVAQLEVTVTWSKGPWRLTSTARARAGPG